MFYLSHGVLITWTKRARTFNNYDESAGLMKCRCPVLQQLRREGRISALAAVPLALTQPHHANS